LEGHLNVKEATSRLPGPRGEQFVELFDHGSLSVEFYAPRGSDAQQPHARDEVYVVVSGSGKFRRGDEEVALTMGDVLFVAAHKEHRFVEFTDDFATWVFFYGPEGGEATGATQ
jgi:mannose-6-phosphate isomerase-like protein (cupin superfamily)